jgi:deazaflavin-dependent oxidoreductase (nitroreductase family)
MSTQNQADQNWNQQIIQEFRANKGKLGGVFEGAPILILHTTGATSGQERIIPTAYIIEGDHWFVIASNDGRPRHPGWYYNLLANPQASIEVGTELINVQASLSPKSERDRVYALAVSLSPNFATYEERTKDIREIPVFVLTRTNSYSGAQKN